jgi:flagellar hook-basal body complex protein FliE
MKLEGYKAYTDILKTQGALARQQVVPHEGVQESFADVLGRQIAKGWQSTELSLKTAEQGMVQAAAGGPVDVTKVVHDIAQAELEFEMATTLREKMLQAFQEISRMPL